MNPIEIRNALLGERVVAALRARHFDAAYYPTAKEAREAALALIPAGSSITFGGSQTLMETGIFDAVKAGNYQVFDRGTVPPAERGDYMRAHFCSDFFLASANALTEDGLILNMDGNGNRVAAMIYGPREVILAVGINKVAKNLDAAIARVRGTAAPVNAARFDIGTPCKKSGTCQNCKCSDSICATMAVQRICRPSGRIHVLLIGENYGF